MKVVYNSKEIMNHTNDYNGLLNRPMINSVTLEGIKTVSDINAYTKEQVDELIGNSRSIEIVTALPTNLIENTLYYVGPDANDFYDVYLVDEVRNVFHIGTSQFGEYFAGRGIDIDADNYITTKIDNKTIIVDSENNLHAVLDIDAVPVMVGATSSVDGEKGLVPQPSIGTQNSVLRGDGVWASVINVIHPVGSIYLSESKAFDPNTLFPGTTWVKLSTGKALWHKSGASTTIEAGLPNANGAFSHRPIKEYTNNTTGALTYDSSISHGYNGISLSGSYVGLGTTFLKFNAKKGTYKTDGTQIAENDSPYGKSSTVQPKAIKICAWRRTA